MSTPVAAAIAWNRVAFADLTPHQLYELLQLRTDVFVMEQACAFQDMDGYDHLAVHLLGTEVPATAAQGQGAPLIAYARLFPAKIKFAEASIGRVITRDTVRGTGLGHVLICEAIRAVAALWGVQPIRIGAQSRLTAYYRQHGFVEVGPTYLEDNIDHQDMLWQPPSNQTDSVNSHGATPP
jgi:ElaA protein